MNKSLVGMWAKPTIPNRETRQQPQNILQETRIEQTQIKKRSSHGESSITKRKKVTTSVDRTPASTYSLDDLGGVDPVIGELRRLVARPFLFPFLCATRGYKPCRGILLHGPPGCGKTMIANAFATILGISFIPLSAPSIVSGMSGESEKALRELFEEAKRLAPCLIFLDEIDAIGPKRENVQKEMEKRIVAQLLTCMDDIALEKTGGKPVMVIAATNQPDALDPALRRGGRFDKEIKMTIPTEAGREQILRALTRGQDLSDDFNFKALAKTTPGFVGADLDLLVSTATEVAADRSIQFLAPKDYEMELDGDSQELICLKREIELSKTSLTKDCVFKVTHTDFTSSIPKIQPMAKREGFAVVPKTTWEDVGALQDVREELRATIVEPILDPEKFIQCGLDAPSAALLWGPPGCGKTLIAKAVANESGAYFISVRGPELLNKFVGESERNIRRVFERARATAPCLIFFDELDVLAPNRNNTTSESSSRVVGTLLTELDGLIERPGVYVLAATNRKDDIDEALLRSGRLETQIYIGLPSKDERVAILRTLTRKLNGVFDEVIMNVAHKCDGFNGADLAHLVRTAKRIWMKRGGTSPKASDLVEAQKKIGPEIKGRKRCSVRDALSNTGNYTAQSAPSI